MNFRVTRAAALLGALAGLGYGEVVAQGTLATGSPHANFGRRPLRPHFTPDPMRVRVRAGGALNAGALHLPPGCAGFVTQRPDLIVDVTGPARDLRFYVVSESDTTLLVNTSEGAWRCNDDSYGGRNPTVDVPAARPGQYDVWVGTLRAGEAAPGTLFVTELATNHP